MSYVARPTLRPVLWAVCVSVASACGAGASWGGITHFAVMVYDEEGQPVEDARASVELFDAKTERRWAAECVTDNAGKCSTPAEWEDCGLLSSRCGVWATYKVSKLGYLRNGALAAYRALRDQRISLSIELRELERPLAVTASYSPGAPPSLSFKGLTFGSTPEAAIVRRFRGATRLGATVYVDSMFYQQAKCGKTPQAECLRDIQPGIKDLFRIGNTSDGEFRFHLMNGTLEGVDARYHTHDFPVILSAFEAKYGPAYATETISVNGPQGVPITGKAVTWKLVDGTVVLRERGTGIDSMSLQMATQRLLAKRREDASKDITDSAGKL